MKKLTSQQIRETWLNFFKERGHHVEPGANLIPQNDPTLLWINSGVAALKKYFDGSEIPPARRITNIQKSIRTNDIENVGKTARHHTFFEMLGNFSIGDYFRKEVIPWAFDILTNEKYFGMPKDKLYVTYNPDDIETKMLWIKSGLDETHLIPLESNYWQIGEGPCGPNTEVFFDRGEKYDEHHLGIKLLSDELENDRYIEIWGIVFSQYNAQNGVSRKDYKELPSKNIDTGAGLERIACILQGTETNFETDLFWPIIKKTEEISHKKYSENKMAFRVIADHIRTCTFAIADGEFFSNEGRGYVLRRLLRRAMRYGMELGINETFLYKLVHTVVEIMQDFYPYLVEKESFVTKLIKLEEEKFIKTLRIGEDLVNNLLESNKTLSGEDAFKLYDTYGFPFELTQEIASEHNIVVKKEDFDKLMDEQKERARSARSTLESMNRQSQDLLKFTAKSEFLYDAYSSKDAVVIGLFKDGISVNSISDEGYLIFDKTPFYAEMGGQVHDIGKAVNDNCELEIENVSLAPNKQNLHFVKVLFGEVSIGDKFNLFVDRERRIQIECNHSATHLLHKALCEVLGTHIEQKGSYVCENYLRFDFGYLEKLTNLELANVESLVNKYINQAIEKNTLILPYDKAIKIGAEHEFNEKYGDVVRVVQFGNISSEFCGGTHVKNTKDIGIFILGSEESISAGTRRIEAYTGASAYKAILQRNKIANEINESLSSKNSIESLDRIKNIIGENKNLELKIEELSSQIALSESKNLLVHAKKIKDKTVVISYFDKLDRSEVIKISDLLKENTNDLVAVLIGQESNGKYPLIVSVSKKISDKVNASNLLKKITIKLGGSGGGRPDLALGALTSIENIDSIEELLKDNL